MEGRAPQGRDEHTATAPTIELMAQVKERIHLVRMPMTRAASCSVESPSWQFQFRVTEEEKKDKHQGQCNQNGPKVDLADDQTMEIVSLNIGNWKRNDL